MIQTAEVLNGTIEPGDRVAIAVGDARYGDGMRIGTVLEISNLTKFSGYAQSEVKVRVEKSSGIVFCGLPYTKTYGDTKRMVKLND